MLSLLIGIVLIVAWVVAQWRTESLASQRVIPAANAWRAVSVVGDTSGVFVSWTQKDFSAPGEAIAYQRDQHLAWGFLHGTGAPRSNPLVNGGSFMNRIGFGYERLTPTRDSGWPGTYRGRWYRAHVPYWALIIGFLGAGLPAVRAEVARRRRLRRVAAGCCPSCGYDLRGTPHGCPECGDAAVNARPQNAA